MIPANMDLIVVTQRWGYPHKDVENYYQIDGQKYVRELKF